MLSQRLSSRRVLDLRGWKADRVRHDIAALIGQRVRVVYFKGRAEKHALPPVEGVVVQAHRHGFLIQGTCREFVSYADLSSRRGRVEVIS